MGTKHQLVQKVEVTHKKSELYIYILLFSLRFGMNKVSLWSTPYIGDKLIPPLIVNPYNGYINHYYWVYDHPLLVGTNGNWSTPALKFTTDSPWSLLTMEFLQFFLIWLCHLVSHSLFIYAKIHHSTKNHNHQHSLYGIFTYIYHPLSVWKCELEKGPPKKIRIHSTFFLVLSQTKVLESWRQKSDFSSNMC